MEQKLRGHSLKNHCKPLTIKKIQISNLEHQAWRLRSDTRSGVRATE